VSIEQRADELTQRLLTELAPAGGRRFDDAEQLAADLGINSLALVFLISRIEETTGRDLSAEVGALGIPMLRVGDVRGLIGTALADQEPLRDNEIASADGDLVAQLRALLVRVGGGQLTGDVEPDAKLANLGLDSQSLVAFYALVEQELGVQFDIDTPSAALASLAGIADHLTAQTANGRDSKGETP
jgi:acyl carrier protein